MNSILAYIFPPCDSKGVTVNLCPPETLPAIPRGSCPSAEDTPGSDGNVNWTSRVDTPGLSSQLCSLPAYGTLGQVCSLLP